MAQVPDPINPDLPPVTGTGDKPDVWGTALNALLGTFRDAINQMIAVMGVSASGVILWNGTSWPAVPSDQTVVFVSANSAAAPAPTGGAIGSAWIGVNA